MMTSPEAGIQYENLDSSAPASGPSRGVLLCSAVFLATAAAASGFGVGYMAFAGKNKHGGDGRDGKVSVRFYGEAFWPECQAFLSSDLKSLLTAPGIHEILDFEFVPFGNAFFANFAPEAGEGPDPLCPVSYTVDGVPSYYNESAADPAKWGEGEAAAARACWTAYCGADGAWSDARCTSGTPIYQHGPGEGLADVLEACAMDAVGAENVLLWWPFVYCLEGVKLNGASYPAFAYGLPEGLSQPDFRAEFGVNASSWAGAIALVMGAAQTCATSTGLNYTALEACADPALPAGGGAMTLGTRGAALEAQAGAATVRLDPPHTGTPWVVLEGAPLNVSWSGGNDLLNWVCAEYLDKHGDGKGAPRGLLPKGCPRVPTAMPKHARVGAASAR